MKRSVIIRRSCTEEEIRWLCRKRMRVGEIDAHLQIFESAVMDKSRGVVVELVPSIRSLSRVLELVLRSPEKNNARAALACSDP